MIETIAPADKQAWLQLRTKDITSTEVSALFGISPYLTKFELWHQKKEGVVVSIGENERMKWGNRLEDSIAQGIAEDQGWKVKRMKNYMRNPELRLGSSFDYSVEPDGILEVKNVDSLAFRDGWIINEDGSVEAPPHIELQVQHQLLVSGRKVSHIGALIGGNRVVLLKREPDPAIIERIKQEVAHFWKTIDDSTPPAPNFAKDAAFIAKLYGYAEVGKVMESDEKIEALAAEYRGHAEAEKEAEAGKKAAKAELLMIMGDAEKVKGAMFSISAGMVGPSHIEYDRAGYRNFRINWRKEKKS